MFWNIWIDSAIDWHHINWMWEQFPIFMFWSADVTQTFLIHFLGRWKTQLPLFDRISTVNNKKPKIRSIKIHVYLPQTCLWHPLASLGVGPVAESLIVVSVLFFFKEVMSVKSCLKTVGPVNLVSPVYLQSILKFLELVLCVHLEQFSDRLPNRGFANNVDFPSLQLLFVFSRGHSYITLLYIVFFLVLLNLKKQNA